MLRRLLVCMLLLVIPGLINAQTSTPPPDPAIIVLDYDGAITYQRPGWTEEQPMMIGGQLETDDFIYPENTTLQVMCPNGEIHMFRQSQLQPNTRIGCEPDRIAVTYQGILRLETTKGGIDDPLVPYLIAPRATLIRHSEIHLVWNPLLHVDYYELKLRSDGEVIWQSDKLDSSSVTDDLYDETAEVDVPTLEQGGSVELMPDVAYTVEICVRFDDTRRRCTTDPGWSSPANLAFYYQPTDLLSNLESQALSRLNQNSAEALYAQAVLLSFPRYTPPTGTEALGYYSEAIQLLERILRDDPNSELAQSPELLNRLGRLYQLVNLPRSAVSNFSAARDFIITLQPTNLDTKVFATLGLAATTPDSSIATSLYNEAVSDLQQLWSPSEYEIQFPVVCNSIGDSCLALDYCQPRGTDCQKWAHENLSTP